MNTRRLLPLTIVLLCALVLAGNVLAGMSSTNYRLDWYVLLTGGGGGPTDSTNYAANFTVGQSAIGAADSTNYEAGIGYWYGVGEYRIYLPLIMRNYH